MSMEILQEEFQRETLVAQQEKIPRDTVDKILCYLDHICILCTYRVVGKVIGISSQPIRYYLLEKCLEASMNDQN